MWVTATGAFLLVAAAAVFVAVQWDHIDERVKLGILAALTGGFLLAGRRLRPVLPATAGVLVHLGAFLIPANIAAVLVHQHAGWPQAVLVEGLTATVSWALLDRVEHSRVLAWATGGAVVVTAAGVGAVTGWPPALVLAAAAVAAEVARRHGAAIGWALVAGLAPVVAFAAPLVPTTVADAATRSGLAGSGPERLALVSGLACAVVLGRNARRRQDLVLVVLAAATAAVGVTTAWVGSHLGGSGHLVGAATLFLAAELVAHAMQRDPFWGAPARVAAAGAEIVAGAGGLLVLTLAWDLTVRAAHGRAPIGDVPRGAAGAAAAAVAAVAWLVADLRRRRPDASGPGLALLLGAGWLPATVFVPLAVLTGVALATTSLPVLAVVAVALAALAVVSGRDGGHGVAVGLALAAPLLAAPDPSVVGAVALAGALVLAGAAVVRARMGDPDLNGPLAWVLATVSLLPLGTAWLVVHTRWSVVSVRADATGPRVSELVAVLALVGAATLVAAVLDRGAARPDVEHLGVIARAAALGCLALTAGLPASEVAVVAAVLTALAVLDAVRLDDPVPLASLPVTAPVLVAAAAQAAGLDLAQTGLALCVLAAVGAGLELVLPARWAGAVRVMTATAAVGGVIATRADLPALSTAFVLLGLVGAALSIGHRSIPAAIGSGVVVTMGVWGHLLAADVTALDAYLAPVALGLLLAGIQARTGSARVSSWVAFGPAVVLLGGSALLERLQGGGGAHALVAGAVGVAAVLAGGARRWAGPLLLGTALLVALTVHESLDVTRTVPTWGWLALGGVVLLGAGIAMERLDTSPVESGRRLVDVVHERFS